MTSATGEYCFDDFIGALYYVISISYANNNGAILFLDV